MRIGYLTSQYPAASHTFIRREIETLRAQGIDIATFSIRRPAPGERRDSLGQMAYDTTGYVLPIDWFALISAHLASLATRPGVYLGTLRLALRHRPPGLKPGLWSLFHFAEAILLARMLRRNGIDRLHNHFGNSAATVGMLAAHFLRMPWSLTLHGISEFDYPAGLLLAAKLEHATFAACVSYFGMAQAMRITRPEIWPRLTLVRCGVDPGALPEARPESGTEPPLDVICVGRLSPEKGHAGLLAATGRLLRKGLPIRLTLVGDGPERESLEALARELDLGDRVAFTGRLHEAAALEAIARSDILVLASFMEGLPIVLMEAMALGVPVVASRVAGIPELVKDGESGLLFDPANWAGLEHAIERLCRDAELRDALASEGRRRVTGEFSYPGAAAPLIARFSKNGR